VSPQIGVRRHEERGIVLALGEAKALFIQLSGGLELPPVTIKRMQSPQNEEEPCGVPHLATQLAGAGVYVPCFRSRHALGVHQRPTQLDLHIQLALSTFGDVRQHPQHIEPCGAVRDRFHIGKPGIAARARPLPVSHCLLGKTRLGVVVCQQFGLCLRQAGKLLGHHLRHALVDLLPCAPEQGLVGGLLDEGMLERVHSLWRHAPLVEHLGPHQLPQATPQRQLI